LSYGPEGCGILPRRPAISRANKGSTWNFELLLEAPRGRATKGTPGGRGPGPHGIHQGFFCLIERIALSLGVHSRSAERDGAASGCRRPPMPFTGQSLLGAVPLRKPSQPSQRRAPTRTSPLHSDRLRQRARQYRLGCDTPVAQGRAVTYKGCSFGTALRGGMPRPPFAWACSGPQPLACPRIQRRGHATPHNARHTPVSGLLFFPLVSPRGE